MISPKISDCRRFDGDEIDHDSLLRLVNIRTTTSEFGYLLRPYWMPATVLDYAYESRQRNPQGRENAEKYTVRRRPVKIDAETFFWKEMVSDSRGDLGDDVFVRLFSVSSSEETCEYDRYRQSFSSQSGSGQTQAFLRMPILPPLMPIPEGFRWHVGNAEAKLDFHLESVRKIDGMTVLFIRRSGSFPVSHYYRHGTKHSGRGAVVREGVSAYALERSVVLEDRIRDVLYLEDDPFGLSGTITTTTARLRRSSLVSEHRLAPLHVKYRTKSGQGYLYDCGTGHILKFGDTVLDMMDDYRLLTAEEIAAKRPELDTATIQTGLKKLDALKEEGYLAGHVPTEASKIELVARGGECYPLREFTERNCTLLVLGLTERCNLDCGYCCYSGKFEGQRTHGPRVMSFEIAKKAIVTLLGQELARGEKYPITFYGGEPLLEFALMRRCVEFSEKYAAEHGKRVRFSLTTNGTLLNDEIVDYLVEHDFLILVSLDGPKEPHDRYRKFPNGKGSFDTVAKNLHRFAERYPDYMKRGINVTLAPPLALEETERFIDELAPKYPMIRAALVGVGVESRFDGCEQAAIRYGCSSCTACEQGAAMSEDSFRQFGEEDAAGLKAMWENVIDGIAEHGEAEYRERKPFAAGLFASRISLLHKRPVTKNPMEWTFYVPCLPGFTRRFCDVDGNYRVCERVDNSDFYIIGNVDHGLDPGKMERIMEQRRHFGDCGNCTAIKSCDICYGRIPKSDAPDEGYDPGFETLCRQTRQTHAATLPVYTGIMERNPRAFEQPPVSEFTLPPEIPLRFGAPGTRLDEEMQKRLENEGASETTELIVGGKSFTLFPQPSPKEFRSFQLEKENIESLMKTLEQAGFHIGTCGDGERPRTTIDSCFDNSNQE